MPPCDAHTEFREQLGDHAKRIVVLEKTDAEYAVRLDNLCKTLDRLVSCLWALVIVLLTGIGGLYFLVYPAAGRAVRL